MALAWVEVDQLLEDGGDDRRLERSDSPHTFLELLELERPAWQAQAACVGVDVGVFFPERGESTAPAETVCAGCAVRAECRDYALERSLARYDLGVWGGMSARQRQRLRDGVPPDELPANAATAHLIGSSEAAERLGVDRSTFSRWTTAGRIRPAAKRHGNGALLFEPAAVDALRR